MTPNEDLEIEFKKESLEILLDQYLRLIIVRKEKKSTSNTCINFIQGKPKKLVRLAPSGFQICRFGHNHTY
jgi:hypothetical protein